MSNNQIKNHTKSVVNKYYRSMAQAEIKNGDCNANIVKIKQKIMQNILEISNILLVYWCFSHLEPDDVAPNKHSSTILHASHYPSHLVFKCFKLLP